MSQDSRIQILDALRGLAAMAVVGYHYSSRYPTLFGGTPLPFEFVGGSYGVNVFFIISGFVIYMTLDALKHPADFIVSRFSRLYPVYWVAMTLTAIVLLACNLPGRGVTIMQYLANLTMVHEFFHVPSVDGVYWTLAVELRFYFWMFLLWLVGAHRHPQRFVLAWLALSMLRSHLPAVISSALILEYFPLFGFGIMMCQLQRNHWRSVPAGLVALACMASTSILEAGLMLLFAAALRFPPQILLSRPLLWLGAISYPLYLIHQNIGYAVISSLDARPASSLLAVAVSLSLASLLTMYVERPATSRLRNTYRKWRARQTTVMQPVADRGSLE